MAGVVGEVVHLVLKFCSCVGEVDGIHPVFEADAADFGRDGCEGVVHAEVFVEEIFEIFCVEHDVVANAGVRVAYDGHKRLAADSLALEVFGGGGTGYFGDGGNQVDQAGEGCCGSSFGEEFRIGDDHGNIDGFLVTVHALFYRLVGPTLFPVVCKTKNKGVFGEPLFVQLVQHGGDLFVHGGMKVRVETAVFRVTNKT